MPSCNADVDRCCSCAGTTTISFFGDAGIPCAPFAGTTAMLFFCDAGICGESDGNGIGGVSVRRNIGVAACASPLPSVGAACPSLAALVVVSVRRNIGVAACASPVPSVGAACPSLAALVVISTARVGRSSSDPRGDDAGIDCDSSSNPGI